MKTVKKLVAIFLLAAMLSLTFATPALAVDGRSGEVVVIKADEVVDDDLYVTANEFTLEGTVKGDLIVFGTYIFINGTVEGDVIGAGNTVVINGTIEDDVRIAGAALQIGDKAFIGGDLLGAGASIETLSGSVVTQDAVFGGAQALLAGSIGRNLTAGANALELRGKVGGDVIADVGEVQQAGPAPTSFISNVRVSIPSVKPGLTIDKNAKIIGDLTYTQTADLNIPEGIVTGTITRNLPAVTETAIPAPPTTGEIVIGWILDLLRTIATLAIFGLLLIWLAPKFMGGLADKLRGRPMPSLGWGIVAYAAFFFALLLIVVVMIIGGIVFGFITLGGVTSTIVWVGILAMFALILGFILFTEFGAQVLVAWLGGRWILSRFSPALAEHRVWPLLLGVVLVGILVKIPMVGWLVDLMIVFFGLGAFWLWERDRLSRQAGVVA